MHAEPEAHVIIVTGAGGGLGGTMSRGLLASGRRIVAVDLAATPGLKALAADAAAHGNAKHLHTLTADIREPAACARVVAAAIERFGTVDGLLNNAAIGPWYTSEGGRPRFYEVPVERWQRTIDTNVNGSFLMAHAVAPALVERGWGRIVTVTTSLGTMTMAGMAPYGPSKGALEASVAVWAHDLEGTGVTSNVLVPGGAADTGMVPLFAAPDRSKLIAPAVMIDPIVWLMSRASDGVTARRFIGTLWDARLSDAENVRKAGAPVAWPP